MITVLEALEQPGFKGARIVAGEAGTERTVRWVYILDSLDLIRHLQGGEFVILTSRAFLLVPESEIAQHLQDIAKKGIAALGIEAVSEGGSAYPVWLIDWAEYNSIPLVELPPQADLEAISRSLTSFIINKSLSLLRRVEEAARQMWNALLSGEGLIKLLATIHNLRGHDVVVEHGDNRWCYPPSNAPTGTLPKGRGTFPQQIGSTLWAPIAYAGEVRGSLWLISKSFVFEEIDFLIADRASLVVSAELMREEAERETRRRKTLEQFEALLIPELGLKQTAAAPAWVGAVLIFPNSVVTSDAEQELAQRLNSFGFTVLTWGQARILRILVGGEEGALRKQLRAFLDTYARRKAASLGVGPIVTTPVALRQSLQEALWDAHWGEYGLGNLAPIVTEDPKQLLQWAEAQLAPIFSLPNAKKKRSLLHTLEAFIESGGNVAETARRLKIRRQSVYYRIKQIEELIGDVRSNHRRTYSLQVALRILLYHKKLDTAV